MYFTYITYINASSCPGTNVEGNTQRLFMLFQVAHADLFYVTMVIHVSGESEDLDAAIAVSGNKHNVQGSSYSVQFNKEKNKQTSVAISGNILYHNGLESRVSGSPDKSFLIYLGSCIYA